MSGDLEAAFRDYARATATQRDDDESAFRAGWQAAIMAQNQEAIEDEIVKGPPGGPIDAARFLGAGQHDWEYGISWDKNYAVIVDEEQDEDRIRQEAAVNGRKLLRRRVGPWEPAEERG